MGRLTRPHLIEAVIWFLIVAIFFAYSFEFDQPIEIYKFGATAWPRVVLGLLLLATLGNLAFQYRHGSDAQAGRVGVAETDEDPVDLGLGGAEPKMLAVLATPFVFAWLLKPVGIYFAAPFFIALIMWLFGERRWRAILIVTVLIYVIFLGLFMVLLNAQLPQGNVAPFYDYSAWILKMNTLLQKMW